MAHIDDATSNPGSPSFNAEFVKLIGEQRGISSISEQCCSQVADFVSCRVKMVMLFAKKASVHGKRTRMIADDLDCALDIFGQQPIHGYGSKKVASNYKPVPGSMESMRSKIFISQDSEIELNTTTSDIVSLRPSFETALHAHWLAIDGIQPEVAQNPVSVKKTVEDDLSSEECDEVASVSSKRDTKTFGGLNGIAASFRFGMKFTRKSEKIQIKSTVTHELSMEQQLFFKEVMEACVGLDDKRRVEALQSLQYDTGLSLLLPHISRWLAQGVRYNIIQRSLAMLIYIVRAYTAISNNRSIQLNSILHEVVPSLMSCMVSQYLCARPDVDNHWTLRDYAAKCLVFIIREHGVCDMRSRVQQILNKVFINESSTIGMRYGAFQALYEISTPFERALFYVHFVQLLRQLQSKNGIRPLSGCPSDAERLYALLSKYEIAMGKYAALYQQNNNVVKLSQMDQLKC